MGLSGQGDVVLTNLVLTPGTGIDLAVSQPDISLGCPGAAACPATDGQTVPVNLTVHNDGTEDASNVDVGFYVGDPSNGGIMVGNTFIPSIAAGGSKPTTFDWDTSQLAGNQTIYAVVNPSGAISETDTTNNETSIPVTVLTKADLSIATGGITLDHTDRVVGEPVTATANICNGGQTGAPASTTKFSIVGSGGDTSSANVATPAIGGGDCQAESDTFSPTTFGEHTVTATADSTDAVTESNKANNVQTAQVYVGLGKTYIDSGSQGDTAYSATTGYGYTDSGGSPYSYGGTPNQTVRLDGSGPVQYRFDGLQPNRSYHLDASFYEEEGDSFTETVQFTNLATKTTIDSGKTVYLNDHGETTTTILVPPAAYSGNPSGSMTVSFTRTDDNGPATVSEVTLQPIQYMSIDAGGPGDTAYSAANGYGYLGSNSFAGSVVAGSTDPNNTFRYSVGSELDYQFDGLSPSTNNYQMDLVMYAGASSTKHQSVFVNGTVVAGCTDVPINTVNELVCKVPAADYKTTGSVKVGIQCVSCSEPRVNIITLEQVTGSDSKIISVTASSGSATYGHSLPKVTPRYSGFQPPDTAKTVLTGAPVCATSAKVGSPAGQHATTCTAGTLKSKNGSYGFVFEPGTLTINLAKPKVTYTGPTKITTGKSATLTSTLFSDQKKPIAGRVLTITLTEGTASQSCVTKSTGKKGTASCAIKKVTLAKGKAIVTVTFAGDPKGPTYDYAPATATAKVTVS